MYPTNITLGYRLEVYYVHSCVLAYFSGDNKQPCKDPGLDFEMLHAYCIWKGINCQYIHEQEIGIVESSNSKTKPTLFQLLLQGKIDAVVNTIPFTTDTCGAGKVICTNAIYAEKIDFITRKIGTSTYSLEVVSLFSGSALLALLTLSIATATTYTLLAYIQKFASIIESKPNSYVQVWLRFFIDSLGVCTRQPLLWPSNWVFAGKLLSAVHQSAIFYLILCVCTGLLTFRKALVPVRYPFSSIQGAVQLINNGQLRMFTEYSPYVAYLVSKGVTKKGWATVIPETKWDETHWEETLSSDCDFSVTKPCWFDMLDWVETANLKSYLAEFPLVAIRDPNEIVGMVFALNNHSIALAADLASTLAVHGGFVENLYRHYFPLISASSIYPTPRSTHDVAHLEMKAAKFAFMFWAMGLGIACLFLALEQHYILKLTFQIKSASWSVPSLDVNAP